jgi:hypothetical protein
VQKGNDTRAAIGDLRKIFPKVPAGAPEGAIDENSTYLHLIDAISNSRRSSVCSAS